MDGEKPVTDGKTASSVFEGIKLDANVVRLILLTACVVIALLAVPLFFIFRNFVTFDALDSYFKVTDSVGPKILHTVTEELDSGYSKNFIFDSTRMADSTMLFYAPANPKVTLSITAQAVAGAFPHLQLLLNNCVIERRDQQFNLYGKDVTKKLEECGPDQPNLHTLKIVLEDELPKSTTIRISLLVLVKNRIRARLAEKVEK